MTPNPYTALAGGFATLCAMVGLTRLIHPGGWLPVSLLAICLVMGTGVLMRRFSRSRALTVFVQLAVVGCFDIAVLVHSSAAFGLLPSPGAFSALNQLISQAGDDIRTTVPPGPSTPGITALLLLVASLVSLLVDATAATYRAAAPAGLPLFALYIVPATRLPGGTNWLFFTFAAIGYLTLLRVEGRERITRWGVPLTRGGGDNGLPRTFTDTPIAGSHIGSAALAVALTAGLILPTLPGNGLERMLHINTGQGGNGTVSGPISISQQVDIKKYLIPTTPIPLLTYRTDAPDPLAQYLRIEALDDFNGEAWTADSLSYQRIAPNGDLPANPPGFLTNDGITSTTVSTSVTITGDITSPTPLPTPYSPSRLLDLVGVAGGEWRYSPSTMDVVADDSNIVSRGLTYTVDSTEPDPTVTQLEDAPPTDYTSDLGLPKNFPAQVTRLARQITAGAPDQYRQALALQSYFREGFKYDLGGGAGDGIAAITAFLASKSGYCQQYAGTMAAMARAIGIPARVAIGFTAGSENTDGSFTATTADLHAWPELYFQGIGWVRFEPTPTSSAAGARGTLPAWQTAATGNPDQAAPTTAPTGAGNATKQSGCGISAQQNRGSCGPLSAPAAAAAPSAFSGLGPAGWLLKGSPLMLALRWLALVAAVLLALPSAVRLRRRRTRARSGRPRRRGMARTPARTPRGDIASMGPRRQALAAWEELRDDATDLGYPWPEAATPRQVRDGLVTAGNLPEDARDAIGRVTLVAERAHYAESVDDLPPDLFQDVRTVRVGLAAQVGHLTRLRANVLPTSVLPRRRRRGEPND